MLAMCRRCEKPMAVLMADIDHFKEYNDAHGHLAATARFAAWAARCEACWRAPRHGMPVRRRGISVHALPGHGRSHAPGSARRAVEELGPCAPDGAAGPADGERGRNGVQPGAGRQRARAAGP
ncbi:MAG: diguanylate cyclase domain-containing protein [Ruthenibacterium lactatiformans]